MCIRDSDQVAAGRGLGDFDGLDDAVLADAVRQFAQSVLVEDAARLVGVGVDGIEADGQQLQPGGLLHVAVGGEEPFQFAAARLDGFCLLYTSRCV